MKVRLKPKISYEVETIGGRSLGTFDKIGKEWEGMMSLRSEDRSENIIVDMGFGIENVFSCLTDNREVAVVKASTSIQSEIHKEQKDS